MTNPMSMSCPSSAMHLSAVVYLYDEAMVLHSYDIQHGKYKHVYYTERTQPARTQVERACWIQWTRIRLRNSTHSFSLTHTPRLKAAEKEGPRLGY